MQVRTIQSLIEHSSAARSTGSTGANSDSSRSHSIMQFALKRTKPDGSVIEPPVGKISFIDLAGSERGADTYDNDRHICLFQMLHARVMVEYNIRVLQNL